VGGPVVRRPLLCAALVVALLWTTGCGPRRPRQRAAVPKAIAAIVPARGIRLYLHDPKTGLPVWRLAIETASFQYHEGKKLLGELRGVSGTLFENGKPALEVRAWRCAADGKKMTLRLDGGVWARAVETGLELRASSVSYDANLKQIVAAGDPLRVTRGTEFEMVDKRLCANTGLQIMHN
jgi:hypothetical protein